jgi:enoyl-CoA hydratase/carnithine racemase
VVDGPFRIQMNETAIGLTLPSFAIAICESVMPAHCHNEALLYAKAYTPAEALAYAMVDDVVPADAVATRAREVAVALTALDRATYAGSKRRLRSRAVAWAEQHLEAEMLGLPIRTGS